MSNYLFVHQEFCKHEWPSEWHHSGSGYLSWKLCKHCRLEKYCFHEHPNIIWTNPVVWNNKP